MNTVPQKVHSELGASTASRWMACPGSVRLSAGLPDSTSAYAQEGTAAHALAELALSRNVSAFTFIGTTLEGVEVTDEMAEAVSVFVDYCSEHAGTESWIEKQFTLQHLNPPGPMFGTADFVVYDAKTRELEVVDFKYGQGVVVDAFENKQLQYYALGAALSLPNETAIDDVKITIVQPRATHSDGVVRSFSMSFIDLLGFSNELLAAAHRTTEADAPLVPGPQCRFCKASGVCPAQRDQAQQVAMVEFDVLETTIPPDPQLVPMTELAEWAQHFSKLEAWMSAVRGRLQGELERGGAVVGWKLVAKRAIRKWVDPIHTSAWLEAQGEDREDIYKIELKSPAQIEKLVGKNKLPDEMVTKQSSGVVMVPESDKREAVTLTPGEEFGVITSGED